MKKIFASLVGLLSIIAAALSAYFIFFKQEETTSVAPAAQTPASTSEDETATVTEENPTEGAALTDGVYTGAVTSTNRGDYQVQLTVAEGQLSDINVILYPDGDPNSVNINGNALPIYTAEALEKQSADINLVSGASEAYKGFTGSLQDAIDQAQQ